MVQEPAFGLKGSPGDQLIRATQPDRVLVGEVLGEAGEVVDGVEAVVVGGGEGARVEVVLQRPGEPEKLGPAVDDRWPVHAQDLSCRRRRHRGADVGQPSEQVGQALSGPVPRSPPIGQPVAGIGRHLERARARVHVGRGRLHSNG